MKSIDYLYDLAKKNGALGGKLIGAGGGGFLLFYVNDTLKLEKIFYKLGIKKLNFDFDTEGTKIVNI